ncbi:amino acid ABC transporter substrate-binding protein [Betaproteobacteria bacterium GR16-43]|nr:amino acid ABC transporter substrate-binding protein [Betaproteobacteria bacterium GR16-43]
MTPFLRTGFAFLTALALLAACASAPVPPVADVAPKGSLRVAVGVGAAASAFWTTRDASGKLRGVTVELGKAAAEQLGIPLQIVEYQNSGEITAAAAKGDWDISFMPGDPEREKFIDPGPAFVVYESGYLVRPGSTIRNAAEVDRAGTRVGAVEGTSTSRTVAKALKQATLTLYPKPETAMQLLAEGKLDAIAAGRDGLLEFSQRTPGTRLLDDVIQSTGVIVVVPKDRPATRAWAAQFLEKAKQDGTVRRALDSAGFTTAQVAPPSTPRP